MKLIRKKLSKGLIEQDLLKDREIIPIAGDMFFLVDVVNMSFVIDDTTFSISIECTGINGKKVKLNFYEMLNLLGKNSLKNININTYLIILFNKKLSKRIEEFLFDKNFDKTNILKLVNHSFSTNEDGKEQGIMISSIMDFLNFLDLKKSK